MRKRIYTTDNIKEHLKNLGFVWLDKLVFDSKINGFRKITRTDLSKPMIMIYLQNPFEKNFKALCEISETQFVLKVGNQKLDDSIGWQEYLNSINKKVTI